MDKYKNDTMINKLLFIISTAYISAAAILNYEISAQHRNGNLNIDAYTQLTAYGLLLSVIILFILLHHLSGIVFSKETDDNGEKILRQQGANIGSSIKILYRLYIAKFYLIVVVAAFFYTLMLVLILNYT